MSRTIKHKFFIYIAATSLLILALAGTVVTPSQHVQAADTTSQALCFYQPTGTLYDCSDVSPSETFTSSDCYTTDGSVDTPTANGPQELIWKSADCSASEFQGTAFADCTQIPATDGQPASDTCALPVSGVGTGSDGASVCNSTDTDCAHIVNGILNPVIDFLAAGVGLIIVVMIIIGGIQYITSQDNPQAVSSAKNRIFNAIIALVLFALMWSLLEWLVPGGVF